MNILETLRREGLDGKFFTLVQEGERYKVIDIKQPRPESKQAWHTGPRLAHWAKPGQRAKPISQEHRAEIERMYLAGFMYKDIRSALKINYVRMREVFRELEARYPEKSAKVRNGAWTEQDIVSLRDLLKQGVTHREIGKTLGRTEEAVQTKIRNLKRKGQ